ITPRVESSDNGTAKLGITVAHKVRKNKKMTMITRHTVSIIVNCTSWTAARITNERSETRSILTEGGIDSLRRGIHLLIVSTSWIVLAPAWRWIARPSAGVSPYHAPMR